MTVCGLQNPPVHVNPQGGLGNIHSDVCTFCCLHIKQFGRGREKISGTGQGVNERLGKGRLNKLQLTVLTLGPLFFK